MISRANADLTAPCFVSVCPDHLHRYRIHDARLVAMNVLQAVPVSKLVSGERIKRIAVEPNVYAPMLPVGKPTVASLTSNNRRRPSALAVFVRAVPDNADRILSDASGNPRLRALDDRALFRRKRYVAVERAGFSTRGRGECNRDPSQHSRSTEHTSVASHCTKTYRTVG